MTISENSSLKLTFLASSSPSTDKGVFILENNKLYCRYACCSIKDDIQDTLWYLSQLYFGDKNFTHSSGRYKKICVKEFAPDNVHWV